MIRLRGDEFSPVRLSVIAAFGVWLGCLPFNVLAASLTLKVRAINPSQTEKRSVEVKAFLPKPAKPDDVVSAGELEVAYDVANKAYCVHKKIEMDPGQNRTFEVVLKDIWSIPDDTVKALSDHAKELSALLKGTDKENTATRLGGLIAENLKSVVELQAANVVGSVKPVDHIRAFESNVDVMERVRRDVGMMENLAIAAGKSPQQLLGAPQANLPPEAGFSGATDSVVTIRIKITNPSPTEKKKEPLKRELPAEIKSTDVLDAGGLQVGVDAARNVCYVYADAVELAPQETKTFEVKVKNPWSGVQKKVQRLESRSEELLKLTKDSPDYKAVAGQAQELLKELAEAKGQKWPDAMNEQYVAFARHQNELLSGVEGRIMRLEELFQPREKPVKFGGPMMDVPRPDRRTTWVVIYIILGFLGFFSVFFFLRWYGRTKSEQLDRKTGPGQSSGTADAGPK